MNKIDLSIIIPVFNTQDYISDCLKSIMDASLENVEIIIIDDGSTDNSREIINEFSKNEKNISYFYQENKGQGAARNKALELAKGDYVYFMDSDDILNPSRFNEIYTIIKDEKLDAIFFDGESFVDSEENNFDNIKNNFDYSRKQSHGYFSSGEKLFNSLSKEKKVFASPCLYIINRNVLLHNGLKFPEKIKYEDEVFTMSLFFHIKNCRHENIIAFRRRIRANSTMTSKYTEKSFKDLVKVFELLILKFEEINFETSDAKEYFVKKLRNTYLTCLDLYHKVNELEVLDCYSKLIALAKEYTYFGFMGRFATFNFNFYNAFRKYALLSRNIFYKNLR